MDTPSADATGPRLATDLELGKDEIEASFLLARTTCPQGELYDFEIAVPRDWNLRFLDSGEPPPDGQPVPLLFATPKDHDRLQLAVLCARLPREVHPQDWLEHWLKSQGHGFVGARNWRTDYGLLADILSAPAGPEATGFQRSMTVRDGDRVFMVMAFTSETDAPHVDFMQTLFLVAIRTFVLKAPTKERFAEPMHVEHVSGGAPFSFLLPDSWTSAGAGDTPPHGDAVTLANGDAGSMLLATVPHPGWADHIEQTMLEKIDAGDITVTGMNAQTVRRRTDALDITLRGGTAVLNGQDLMLYSARFRDAHRSGAVVMVSPSESLSFQDHAINRRAFELLVDTLTPGG